MSIYMTVFKCICMHEYMYVCLHVCIVCVYTCVHASICICMYVYMYACVHTCMYICNFQVGFWAVQGGNCPSWEGELSGGKCPGPFYPCPSLSDHITQLSRSCFMHIGDLRWIRPMLHLKIASTIATSIVHAKLDYCNSLFLNIDLTQNKPPPSYSECSRPCC